VCQPADSWVIPENSCGAISRGRDAYGESFFRAIGSLRIFGNICLEIA
jgi:hypothetical protein